jgi:hypothetical protein
VVGVEIRQDKFLSAITQISGLKHKLRQRQNSIISQPVSPIPKQGDYYGKTINITKLEEGRR